MGYNYAIVSEVVGVKKMKMNRVILLSLFVLVLLATSASAVLQVGTLTVGSSTSDVSNPNHDSSSSQVINLTGTLTVTNNGTFTVTNLGIDSVTAVSTFGSDIVLSTVGIDSSPTSLAPNASGTITFRVKAPKNLDAVDSNLAAVAFKVGSLVVNATENGTKITSSSVDINMQRKNQLTIKSVKWKIGGKSQTADEENDEVKDVKPGDKVRVEFEIENEYSDSANVDIDDVEFKIKSLESKLDLDEDDDFDISSDDTQTGSFEFDVDEDTDDGTYNVEMTLSGKDDFNAKHGQKVKIRFKVERESHEVAIKSTTLSPDKVGCEATNVRLLVSYVNIGKSDEDEVAIEIDSPKLNNFNKKITDIQLDEDDGDSSLFNILIPAALESGAYTIDVKTFYDQSKLSDNQAVVLNVNCDKPGVKPITSTGTSKQSATLSLTSNKIDVKQGGSTSLGVNVVNTGSQEATFTVNVDADWANSVGSKSVTLTPGATSSVVFNLVAKDDAKAGQNSAVVEVKAGNSVVTSQAVDVSVESSNVEAKQISDASSFFKENSTAIWIIADIVLILIAIGLLKVLFFRKSPPRTF